MTRSAICQARKKASHKVLIGLLDIICRFLNRRSELQTYKGFRTLAVDSSTMLQSDTKENRQRLGTAKSEKAGKGRAIARVSILHDVLNRLTYDASIDSYSEGEQPLAWEHLETAGLPTKSVFYWTLAMLVFISCDTFRTLTITLVCASKPICRQLPIAPSTYYEHKAKQADPSRQSRPRQRDQNLFVEIQRVWEETFRVYGARKVWLKLNREGIRVAGCTIERLKKLLALKEIRRGRKCQTTVADQNAERPVALVNRQLLQHGQTHCGSQISPL